MTIQRRRAFRACLTAGIMLAGGLALLPAQATTAPRVVLPATGTVSGVRLLDVKGGAQELSAGPETLDRLLRAADFSAGPTVALDVARKALVQRGGPVQPDLDPTTSLSGETGEAATVAGEDAVAVAHSWTWSFPVTDLDGDGGQDLLVRTYVDGSVVTEALSGADSHRLWRMPAGLLGDSYVSPGGDVDGDGVDDFSFHGLQSAGSVDEECTDDGCESAVSYEFVQRAVVVSGATGAVLWSAEEPGSAEMSRGNRYRSRLLRSTYESWGTFRLENLFVGPDLGRTGESIPGLVTNRIDIDDRYVGSNVKTARVMTLSSSESELHSSTVAEIVDPTTGVSRVLLQSEGPHISSLSWSGQLTGDTSPDLLWVGNGETATSHRCRTIDALATDVERCTDDREPAFPLTHLVALDGSTLDEVWSTDIESPGWAWSGSDVTGDGLGDIRLIDYWTATTRLVSGADGGELWLGRGMPLDDMGDLGGGPHPDLVLVRFHGSWGDGTRTVSLQRVDGATGASLLTTEHVLDVTDANMTMLGVNRAPNAGGSLSADLVVNVASAHLEWDSAEVHNPTSTDVVEDGVTGEPISSRQRDLFGGLYGIGDVTGDGLTEGISWRYDFELVEDEWGTYLGTRHVEESIVALSTLAEHMALSTDWFFNGTIDVDGADPRELLFGRWVQFPDGGSTTELSVVNASDGSTRWTWSYSP